MVNFDINTGFAFATLSFIGGLLIYGFYLINKELSKEDRSAFIIFLIIFILLFIFGGLAL